MKEYSSFEEIDRDLKILKLQNEIDKEEVKLSINRTKSALSPVEIIKSAASVVKKKVLEYTAVAKAVGQEMLNSKN